MAVLTLKLTFYASAIFEVVSFDFRNFPAIAVTAQLTVAGTDVQSFELAGPVQVYNLPLISDKE